MTWQTLTTLARTYWKHAAIALVGVLIVCCFLAGGVWALLGLSLAFNAFVAFDLYQHHIQGQ